MDEKQDDGECKLDLNKELFTSIPFQIKGMLSPESKRLLTQPSNERIGGLFLNLITELEDIEFFRNFPTPVKERLAKSMLYSTMEPNQMVLTQGHQPTAMFVLLSGVVSLRYNMDRSIGGHSQWPEMVLRRGAAFGQQDLLMNRPSTVDAYCVGHCELLSLQDIEIVREALQNEIERSNEYIRSSTPLSRFGWSEQEYRVLELYSELREYFENVQIYDGTEGTKPRRSRFLVSGECKLVRDVHYTPGEQRHGVKEYRTSPGGLKKALVFETVREGFYFGVGEDFGRNRVMATPATACLFVPRLVLVFKDKALLENMRVDLVRSIPTDQFVLDNFAGHEYAVKEVEHLLGDMFKEKTHRLKGCRESKQKSPFVKYV